MPSWKKLITSGSSAHLNHVTASGQSHFASDVGIGTTSPNMALDVSGSIRSDQKRITALADPAVTGVDFRHANNWEMTLTDNCTIRSSHESSCVGQSGIVVFIQDAAGGNTPTLPTTWLTPRGDSITFDTSGTMLNIISYYIYSSTKVLVNYMGDFS